jgi:hypothetical protein
MKMQLARHNEILFNEILMSPEKVSSIFVSCLEILKKCKRRLQGVPFSEIV